MPHNSNPLLPAAFHAKSVSIIRLTTVYLYDGIDICFFFGIKYPAPSWYVEQASHPTIATPLGPPISSMVEELGPKSYGWAASRVIPMIVCDGGVFILLHSSSSLLRFHILSCRFAILELQREEILRDNDMVLIHAGAPQVSLYT